MRRNVGHGGCTCNATSLRSLHESLSAFRRNETGVTARPADCRGTAERRAIGMRFIPFHSHPGKPFLVARMKRIARQTRERRGRSAAAFHGPGPELGAVKRIWTARGQRFRALRQPLPSPDGAVAFILSERS